MQGRKYGQGLDMKKPKHLTMKALVDAGAHLGHLKSRWNPKMRPYIYGTQGNTQIIDLGKTMRIYTRAEEFVRKCAQEGYQFLFVGTKSQAQDPIFSAAQRCGAYYVNHRWLGGLLTNFQTIRQSVKKMEQMKKQIEQESEGLSRTLTKKELGLMRKEVSKLERSIGGIAKARKIDRNSKFVLFIADTNVERNAINEARKFGFPIVAIVDTNSDPDLVDYPIPANDDAAKSIHTIMSAFAETIAEVRDNKETIVPKEEPTEIEKN